MPDAPRQHTVEEARELFLGHVRGMIRYWANLPVSQKPADETEAEWRTSGIAFSILAAIDGSAMALPGYVLAPAPHPDEQELLRAEGSNWHPPAPDAPFDIAGPLHELLGRLDAPAPTGPKFAVVEDADGSATVLVEPKMA